MKIKLIISTAILGGIVFVVSELFGIGWPFYIVSVVGLFVWFSVNNELFKKFGG